MKLARALALQRTGRLADADLARLSAGARDRLATEVSAWLREDMKQNQLVYYEPVNDDARRIHLSTARQVGIKGGNKSAKTGTLLAEAAIQMTSVCPASLAADYPRGKLPGRPIRARLVVTSLVNAWDNNLKHKLQWHFWNGRPEARHGLIGDPRCGHWGFIPRRFLIDGSWEKSWDEKHRILTLQHPRTHAPWSTLQVMSHDQDLSDFNQGAFDLVIEDEIPPEEIHRANMIRAMELNGRVMTGGTPPDERTGAVAVAWFYDQVLAPGLEGSDPEAVYAVSLWTERNRTLDPAWVEQFSRDLTPEQREARLHGESLHLSGLIIRGFTEKPRTWCFTCESAVLPAGATCPRCAGRDLVAYCHLWDDEDLLWPGPREWPVLFYMDPHQSRPTACAWYKIDPEDNWWQIAELEVPGDAAVVKREVERLEREGGFGVPLWRKADPKITVQANQYAQRFEGELFTIRRAFEDVGFAFDDANTNFTVAVERLEQALRPNRYTRGPRLRVHRSCRQTAYHVTHFTYLAGRRDPAGGSDKPSRKNSDFVACARYLAMDDPDWRGCQALRHQTRVSLFAPDRLGRSVTGW